MAIEAINIAIAIYRDIIDDYLDGRMQLYNQIRCMDEVLYRKITSAGRYVVDHTTCGIYLYSLQQDHNKCLDTLNDLTGGA